MSNATGSNKWRPPLEQERRYRNARLKRKMAAWKAERAIQAGIAAPTLRLAELYAAKGHMAEAARLLAMGPCKSRVEALRAFRPEPQAKPVQAAIYGMND